MTVNILKIFGPFITELLLSCSNNSTDIHDVSGKKK